MPHKNLKGKYKTWSYMELAVKWWFGSQSRWVQKAWSATCNLRKPDELYVLGCYTAMLYTGVYFWIQDAQSVAQPVEAQETRAPLISQLLVLIKCTNSRVIISP